MVILKRAVEYVYILSFLTLVTILSRLCIGVIVAANTNVDPDVSTRDVGIAYLVLFTMPLPLWLSYGFYNALAEAYVVTQCCGSIGACVFVGLFIVTLVNNDPSSMLKIQIYAIGMAASILAVIGSLLES